MDWILMFSQNDNLNDGALILDSGNKLLKIGFEIYFFYIFKFLKNLKFINFNKFKIN